MDGSQAEHDGDDGGTTKREDVAWERDIEKSLKTIAENRLTTNKFSTYYLYKQQNESVAFHFTY